MKVGIVGAGTMGSLFGSRLFRSGIDTVLLDNNESLCQTIQRDGLYVQEKDEKYHSLVPIYTTGKYDDKLDIVILLVKSPNVQPAIKSIIKNLKESTIVVSLVNGLGHHEYILPHVDKNRFIIGATALGAIIDTPGQVRWTYEGETYIGPMDGQVTEEIQSIREIFNKAGISTILTDQINDYIWTKLIINIAYNALTSILEITNGELVGSEQGRQLMGLLVDEAVAVAKAKNISIHYSNPMKAVIDIGEFIGPNRSSMLQDILANRPTEIDAINGAIVRMGKQIGLDVKTNEVITQLVKLKEGGSLSTSIRILENASKK